MYFVLSHLYDGQSISAYIRSDTLLNSGYVVSVYRDDTNGDYLSLDIYGGSSITYPISLNWDDMFGLRTIDETITAFYKPAGGSWASVLSITDTTYIDAGYAGFRMTNGEYSGYIDNFYGGDVICQPVVMVTPDAYTHTLDSGNTVFMPLIITPGQMYLGFIFLSLGLIGVAQFMIRFYR